MFSIPFPSFDKLSAEELKKALKSMKEAANQGPVRGGVLSEGDAAAYALVWEWGNARQTKQGPKTTKSTNPDGKEVWLTIQAPHGYIRINEPEYINILERNLAEMKLDNWEDADEIRNAMKKASVKAAEEIAEVIKATAPVDTGALRESIVPADPDDSDLASDDDELELGVGFAHHMFMKTVKDVNS